MKFVLIGHPCVDEIHSADGTVTKSWGGIMYALATMEYSAQGDDVIYPVFPIGRDEEAAFRDFISQYKHVDASGVYAVDAPTNKMKLVYKSGTEKGQRDEHCECVLPPIDYDVIRPHLREAHLVLINMISGFEITLDTLRKIRAAGRRPRIFIYLDAHAMVLGDLVPNGPRKFKHIPDWKDWVMNVDGIQMNEREVKYFSRSEKSLADFAMTFRNIQAIVITRGEKGTSVFMREALKGVKINDVFTRIDVPPITLGPAQDSTGCGDVFGGAFLVRYGWTRHPVLSTQFGNFAAAAKSLFSGMDNILQLRDHIKQFPFFE